MAYFEYKKNRIFYEVKGQRNDSVPLVFLHGWATTSKIWQKQIDFFSRNKKVITVDISSYGDSFIDSLHYLLEHIAKEDKIVLIGWSLGSLLSIDLVLRHKELIKSLVLVGATSSFVNRNGYNAGVPDVLVKRLYKKVKRDKKEALKEFYLLSLTKEEQKGNLLNSQINAEDSEEGVLLEGLDSLLNMDFSTNVARIDLPTLIVHGDSDAICPVASAHYINSKIANSRVEIFEDTGHIPFLTRPDKFNNILEKWID